MSTPTDQIRDISFARQMCASGMARELRVSAQLRVAEVAKELGVHKSTVWRWEKRMRIPADPAITSAYGRLLRNLNDGVA